MGTMGGCWLWLERTVSGTWLRMGISDIISANPRAGQMRRPCQMWVLRCSTGLPRSVRHTKSYDGKARGGMILLLLMVTLLACSELSYAGESVNGQPAESASLSSPARAESGKVLDPIIGEILVSRGSLPAWEQAPSGLFLTKGRQVTTVDRDTVWKVTGKKAIASLFFGTKYYLRIQPSDAASKSPCLTEECWVYQGRTGAKLPENLLRESLK